MRTFVRVTIFEQVITYPTGSMHDHHLLLVTGPGCVAKETRRASCTAGINFAAPTNQIR
jgi:hypothetical protein